MKPFSRTTASTVSALALVRMFDCGNGVAATDQQQRHRQEQSIPRNFEAVDEQYVPPWRDPEPNPPIISISTPVDTSTSSPTLRPTNPPTNPPTESPTTAPPTRAPTARPVQSFDFESGVLLNTTFDEGSGAKETSCNFMPAIGSFVTEVLDIEYFIYLGDDGIDDTDAIQDIVDSYIEPRLHDALVDIGMGCNSVDFVTAKHTMVDLASSAKDLIGAQCLVDPSGDDAMLANATACYQVWGKLEATMWFAPRRQRQLQVSTTPFGDRQAFNDFTQWMEEAFDSLTGGSDTAIQSNSDVEFLKATFQGYANVNEFGGTDLQNAQGAGINIDRTSAFMGTAWSVEDGSITVYGILALVAGVMVFAFVIVLVVKRRRRNVDDFLEHAKGVEELELDSKDDLNDDAVFVDDDDLFREELSLPEQFKVKLESSDHDYRWIGEERKNPIFVATNRNTQFQEHLNVLQQRKEEEQRIKNYEVAVL